MAVGVAMTSTVMLATPYAGPALAEPIQPRVTGIDSGIDTGDRAAVADAYLGIIEPALAVPSQWTGSTSSCTAGSVSAAFTAAGLETINTVRGMLDLPPVRLASSLSADAQEAALMMRANNALSHYPPTSWQCYTEAGARGAAKGNLALGAAGAKAVLLYMSDPGSGNREAGHRRWILDTDLYDIGMGDTSSSNNMVVIGGAKRDGAAPRWLPWPTAGYFPRQLWPAPEWDPSAGRLSLGYPRADFTRATVTMTRAGVAVPVTVNPVVNGYGENTIVWETSDIPSASSDTTYSISVQGIVMPTGETVSHEYDVTVFTPRRDESRPTPPQQVTASMTTPGTFDITWSAPSYAGTSPVAEYEVLDGAGTSVCVVQVTRCVASGVTKGVVTFTVKARNASGWSRSSTPSSPIDYVTKPGRPTLAPATVRGRVVAVTWSAPQDTGGLPIAWYQVRRNSGPWLTIVDGTSATVHIPRGQQSVRISVRAMNDLGPGASSSQHVKRPSSGR